MPYGCAQLAAAAPPGQGHDEEEVDDAGHPEAAASTAAAREDIGAAPLLAPVEAPEKVAAAPAVPLPVPVEAPQKAPAANDAADTDTAAAGSETEATKWQRPSLPSFVVPEVTCDDVKDPPDAVLPQVHC